MSCTRKWLYINFETIRLNYCTSVMFNVLGLEVSDIGGLRIILKSCSMPTFLALESILVSFHLFQPAFQYVVVESCQLFPIC